MDGGESVIEQYAALVAGAGIKSVIGNGEQAGTRDGKSAATTWSEPIILTNCHLSKSIGQTIALNPDRCISGYARPVGRRLQIGAVLASTGEYHLKSSMRLSQLLAVKKYWGVVCWSENSRVAAMNDNLLARGEADGWLPVTAAFALPLSEIAFSAVRSQGPGGQNVNKVASAIHLRIDIAASSLPAPYKERLLALRDQRISKDGVLVIKAQQSRSQEQNKADALARLQQLLQAAAAVPIPRRPTRPSMSARRERVEHKVRRGLVKALRGKVAG